MRTKYFSILLAALSIVCIFMSAAQADQDLTSKIKIIPSGVSFDSRTGRTSINFELWNISRDTLSGPFKILIEKIDNNDVSLKNPDGYDSSGKPYYLYSQTKLSPGKMTASKKWIFEHKCKKITVVEFKEHTLLQIIFHGPCSNLVTVYVSILGPGINANHAPVANAGPDQTVSRTNQVQLDGSGSSDADHDSLTYLWSFISKPTGSQAVIAGPNTMKPTFVPDVAGTYVIQLIVNDGKVSSPPDTVSITASPRVMTVPNVVGLLQADALSALSAASLIAGSVTQDHSSTVPVGRVISQNPITGTSIPEGSAVNFVVSLGPVMVTVPNVVNMTQAAAQSGITAAHLSVGTTTTANDGSIPSGSVISQAPAAGSSVPEGTSVSLVISLGPAMVNVPNVVGMIQTNAEATITTIGLKVGAISTKNSNTITAGSVISQDPSSETSVPQGSSVNLVISLGSVEVLLAPTAKVLDETTMNSLSSISQDGMTLFFAATTPQLDSIQTGDVIISGVTAVTPGGILRKVVSIEKRGDGTVEVTTEPASLTDAFQELHVNGTIPSVRVRPLASQQAPLAAPMAVTTATLPPITYSIPSTDFALSGNYQSTLFGNYTFNPDLDYEIDISWFTLENFKLVLKGPQTLTLNEQLQIEASGSWSREVSLVKEPLFIAAVPTTIPFVVFTLEFIPSIGFETSVGGQLDLGFGFTASNNLTAGVQYSNGTWSSITSYDYSFNHYYSLAGDTTFSIRPYFRGRIGFYLDDVLGPYIDLQPYGKWSFITYPEVYEEFGVGMEGNAGGEVKVLTKALEDISLQLFDLYYPIFPHSTPTLISGKVTNAESLGLAGVTLSLNGTVDLSDTNGNYSFKVDQNETYIITPMLVGYTFDPASRTVTVFETNVAGQDFIAHINAPSPVLTSITIAPATAALTIGNTQQFTAQAFDQFNAPMVPQATFTWASSNISIGTVSATGLFSALSAGGPINVTASVGSVSGSASVTVSAPAPTLTSISVAPAAATLTVGSIQQFTATALDQYGNPIIPQPSFIWTSSNASIGTVDATGLFTGVSTGGPITITASVGSVSGSTSVMVVGLPPPPPPLQGIVNLPRTGQTTCYDQSGNVINCPGTGQDGDIQAGVTWPSPRFVDHGDGTVTDNLTGLIWMKDANLPGSTKTWQEALNYVAAINAGMYQNFGYTDWRLPNINELESLVNAGVPNTATWLNGQSFTNVQSQYYWSSTTYIHWTQAAGTISMYEGSFDHYDKLSHWSIWPVRGTISGSAQLWKTGQTNCYDASGNVTNCAGTGQDGEIRTGVSWPSPRFTDHGDGTVTDNLTGLTWTKNTNLPGESKTWQEALNYVAGMNAGTYQNFGYTDWRLPNRKELFSLFDHSQYNPALPFGYPFTNVQSIPYWSSTTYYNDAGATNNAWIVSLEGLGNGGIYKSQPYYVWPVRGGITESLWPMFQHDAQHTGQSPYSGIQQPHLKWKFEGISGAIDAPAVDGDGTIYLAASKLYAIDKNGQLIWISNKEAVVHPAIRSGVIYVISNQGLAAIDQWGQLKWEKILPFIYYAVRPVIDDKGLIYYVAGCIFRDGQTHNCLICFDTTGEIVWLFDTTDGKTYQKPTFDIAPQGHDSGVDPGAATSPAIGQDGTIYFGCDNQLFAVDSTGSQKWSKSFSGGFGTPAVSPQGLIYVSTGEYTHALTASGDSVWTVANLYYSSRQSPAVALDGTLYASGAHMGGPGLAYPISFAIDANGNVKWIANMSYTPSSPAISGDGIVYISDWNGTGMIIAYDALGNEIWRFSPSGKGFVARSLSIGSDGTLYVPGGDTLYAVGQQQ